MNRSKQLKVALFCVMIFCLLLSGYFIYMHELVMGISIALVGYLVNLKLDTLVYPLLPALPENKYKNSPKKRELAYSDGLYDPGYLEDYSKRVQTRFLDKNGNDSEVTTTKYLDVSAFEDCFLPQLEPKRGHNYIHEEFLELVQNDTTETTTLLRRFKASRALKDPLYYFETLERDPFRISISAKIALSYFINLSKNYRALEFHNTSYWFIINKKFGDPSATLHDLMLMQIDLGVSANYTVSKRSYKHWSEYVSFNKNTFTELRFVVPISHSNVVQQKQLSIDESTSLQN